jgi:parvulin-like peptidyl-prolyl isomerase
MKWILLSTFFLTTSIFANTADPIVAEVNGKKIKKSTLLSYHKQNLNFVQNKKKVTIEQSLNDLIDRIVGIDAAKKVNLHKRADVIKKMNDIVYHAYVSDQLAPKLNKIKKATDQEIKNYYKKYPEYKTSQILLRLRSIPSKNEVIDIVNIANDIYKSAMKNPKNFEGLAQKHSQATTAMAGGDMGYQPKTRLATEYYDAIKGKRIGHITKPFRTQYGLHIVKVTGLKQFKQIDKTLYKKILHDIKRDKILTSYFATQRNSAKVKINKKELK